MSLSLPSLPTGHQILGPIAVGAETEAHRVLHLPSGETRVLEVASVGPVRDPGSLARRFSQLAEGFDDLQHPHVARLFAHGADGGKVWWLRERVAGRGVGELVSDRPLPAVPLVVEIARQILAALGAVHGQGHLLRGLAPSSLVLAADPSGARVVLTDLGLGRGFENEVGATAQGLYFGRLRYASPEQFDDQKALGPPSDLYALGLVLYELLTGRHPIHAETPSSLIAGHLFRPPLGFDGTDPEGRVPEPLRKLVLRALAKEPSERFSDAWGMAEALAAAVAQARIGPAEVDGIGPPSAPRANLDSGLLDVESRVEDGDLEAAQQRLADLRREHGDRTALLDMDGRLREVESFSQRREARGLLAKAQARASAEDFEGAVALLERASELAAGDPEIKDLLEHTRQRARSRAHAVEATRQIAISAVPGIPEEEAPVASPEVLLEHARALAQGEDFAGARERLRKVLGQIPDHREALMLLASVDACLRIRDEEAEQASDVERTVTGIRQLLDDGRAADATVQLERATDRFGEQGSLDGLRFEMAQRRLEPEAPDPNHTVHLAVPPQGIADGETGALTEASTTRPIPVRREPAREDGAQPKTEAGIELPGSRTIPMATIEGARRRGGGAGNGPGTPAPDRRPSSAPSPSPGTEELAETQTVQPKPSSIPIGSVTLPMEAIEGARRRAMERAAPGDVLPEPAGARAPRLDQRPGAGSPPGAAQEPPPVPAVPPTPPRRPAPAAEARPSPEPPRTPLALEDLGFGGGDDVAPPVATSAPHRPDPRGSDRRGGGSVGRSSPPGGGASRAAVLVGVGAALVLVFVLSYMLSGSGLLDRAPAPDAAPEAEDVAPSQLATGWLTVDAVPWANVRRVTDQAGVEVPWNGARSTPLRLELPPGVYRVELVHPDGGRRTLELSVKSGASTKEVARFPKMDVEEYFRRVGW
ncbi:MAG: protein kinase [Acidobacteriota bacterium]